MSEQKYLKCDLNGLHVLLFIEDIKKVDAEVSATTKALLPSILNKSMEGLQLQFAGAKVTGNTSNNSGFVVEFPLFIQNKITYEISIAVSNKSYKFAFVHIKSSDGLLFVNGRKV